MIEKSTGLLILLGSILGAILFGSGFLAFIDVSSILIVGGPLFILFFLKIFNQKGSLNDIPSGKELSHWELLGSTSLHLGIVGGFFGFVVMLKNLSDPSSIGPAMAVTLISMFYSLIGFLISFFLGNFKARPSYYYIPIFQLTFVVMTVYTILLAFKKV